MDYFDKYRFHKDNPEEFGINLKEFEKPKVLDESHLSNYYLTQSEYKEIYQKSSSMKKY